MKKIYRLKGLDCANCAANLENQINKLEGINNASISFLTERLVIEINDDNEKEIIKRLKKLVKKEEPDAELEDL